MAIHTSPMLPALTAAEMAAVDRAMFEVCGLDVLQVMEIAGRAIASWARSEVFGGICSERRVSILCGMGGNGGDGLVAARYLQGWGARVAVTMSTPPAENSVTAHQLGIVEKLGISIVDAAGLPIQPEPELVIDALLGFGSRGAPRAEPAALIEQANAWKAPTLAIDLPSGIDATTGVVSSPCVRAWATITLGLPKTGLLSDAAEAVVGRIVVADIGIPDLAFRSAGIEPPRFAWQGDWLQIRDDETGEG